MERMSDGQRSRVPTDEELLEELRRLLAARGNLSASLIEASKFTRAPNTYIRRFGSLVAAYARLDTRLVSASVRRQSDFGSRVRAESPANDRPEVR